MFLSGPSFSGNVISLDAVDDGLIAISTDGIVLRSCSFHLSEKLFEICPRNEKGNCSITK